MNKVLANSSATFVSLAILFEMPGAALAAAIWWANPADRDLPGGGLDYCRCRPGD
jgi:hypothetical protein